MNESKPVRQEPASAKVHASRIRSALLLPLDLSFLLPPSSATLQLCNCATVQLCNSLLPSSSLSQSVACVVAVGQLILCLKTGPDFFPHAQSTWILFAIRNRPSQSIREIPPPPSIIYLQGDGQPFVHLKNLLFSSSCSARSQTAPAIVQCKHFLPCDARNRSSNPAFSWSRSWRNYLG
jgi:hypothetical protein